jgi:hypothetical protein
VQFVFVFLAVAAWNNSWKSCRDAHMQERFACLVPEYGGLYYDDAGLNVWVTDTTRAAYIRETMRRALNRPPGRPIFLRPAKYSYNQLAVYLQPIMKFAGFPNGVSAIALGNRENRVRLNYVSEEARVAIWRMIDTLHLPREAFVVEYADYVDVRGPKEPPIPPVGH